MSATMFLNGKPRKQLSDQLDRLDAILDVLSDGLSAAVTDAVKAGTAVAVKEALVEVLTNPDMLATLRAGLSGPAEAVPVPTPAAVPAGPGLFARLKAKLAAARARVAAITCRVTDAIGWAATAVRTKLTRGAATAVTRARTVTRAVTAVATLTRVVRTARRAALTGGVVLALAGLLGLVAPHLLAAAVSGVTAALTVVGLHARDGARKLLALN